ncbi:MAG: acetolactate synthase small subunit [Clostridiales bacterium]
MKHTLAVLVEDRPGVLTHVAGLIARRGFNIVSINAGSSEVSGITRITVVVDVADEDELEQVTNQIEKLVDALHVTNLTAMPSINRELALIKVMALPKDRSGLVDIANIFRAKIVDVHPDSIVIEMTGEEDKIDAMCLLLDEMGILEIVRTGRIAISRGLPSSQQK